MIRIINKTYQIMHLFGSYILTKIYNNIKIFYQLKFILTFTK